MAARKRRRVSKRRTSTVKTRLTNVIKSLVDIKKHVSGGTTKGKRSKRGSAKTIKDILPPIYDEEEPVTLDSPTIRRPPRSGMQTLRSASMRGRSPAGQTLRMY